MYYTIFYTKEYQRYIHYIKTDNIERIEEYLKELLGAKEIKKITDMYYIVDNIDINIYPIEVKELSAGQKEKR